ncbi:MAG: winged helix-turn-helix domain-containing protein, partial [Maricaulaceae bacterium]
MRPLLEQLTEGEVRTRHLIEPIADQFGLSENERQEKIPSGKQ